MTDFDKQCLEKIPHTDLREICDRAFFITKAAFGDVRNFSFQYCTECSKLYPTKHLKKVPCITNISDLTALCSSHFLDKIQKELCQKYLDKHRPKLDLKDFTRI